MRPDSGMGIKIVPHILLHFGVGLWPALMVCEIMGFLLFFVIPLVFLRRIGGFNSKK